MGIFTVGLAAMAIHQVVAEARARATVRNRYRAAERAALEAGKPLLVVGGPYGAGPFRHTFNMPSHPGGDVCVDLWDRACDGSLFQIGDIRHLPFSDGQFGAVLSSHVLEHMESLEDVTTAWAELHRVADNVFVALPEKDSAPAWLAPGHHLWVRETGPGTIEIEERRGDRRRAAVRAQATRPLMGVAV